MLDVLFTGILDMTLTGSIVILAVLLGRLALRRMPRIFSYCLWSVVLLRLLCPVGITLPVASGIEVPSVSENYTLDRVEVSLPEAGKLALEGLTAVTNADPTNDIVTIPEASADAAVSDGTTARTCAPWESWVLLGQYIWAAGALAVAGVSLIRYLRLRGVLSEAICLGKRVYAGDGIGTSFVLGLLRPRIYLPSAVSAQEADLLLLHERHHIRRMDQVWKALGFLALCLHWFNPLVWLAFGLAVQDMEMSCDEAVVSKLGPKGRADYAQALLRFSAGGILRPTPAFAQGDPGKRIRNLRQWKQPRRWLSLVTAACCAMLMFGCALDGTAGGSNDSTENTGSIPAENQEPVIYPAAELLWDIKNRPEDDPDEEYFQLPEYPDTEFCRNGASVYIKFGDQWVSVITGYSLYLADLNGDGKRELVTGTGIGSGIINYRIDVYDVAEDMYYRMDQRFENDYVPSVENGKLVVCRYKSGLGYINDEELLLDTGTLVIANRKIYYVSEDWKIPGAVVNDRFCPEEWEAACTQIQDYFSRGMWFDIYYHDCTNYYMERHMELLRPAIAEQEENRIWFDSKLMGENADTLQYLQLLNGLSSQYVAHLSVSQRYIYRDPEKPEQLFVCTELRDTGYRDIQAYYEALVAGECQAHEDTYLVRLDSNAIYRWGESENLYTPIS